MAGPARSNQQVNSRRKVEHKPSLLLTIQQVAVTHRLFMVALRLINLLRVVVPSQAQVQLFRSQLNQR
jgi:hypothetical protein